VRLKVSRRGVALGLIFGIAATLTGIVVIRYTEAFYLVLVFWIVAPVLLVQSYRCVRRLLGRE
jgi:hypothetical protein